MMLSGLGMVRLSRALCVAVALVLPGISAAHEVLLTLRDGDKVVEIDRALLDALPSREIRTSTLWTTGVQSFGGALLTDLLSVLEIDANRLRAVASNDYSVEIPLESDADRQALLAYTRNGQPMTVRDKGPIWLVYPFDDAPVFRSEVFYARAIWQLRKIDVLQ